LLTGSAGRALIRQALPILVLNLVFTFAVPGISVAGHLGGLFTGFIVSFLIYRAPKPVYAQVVDANTGEQLESQIQEP
jgi:membrane associated rhomboid family serine protease